MDATSRRPWHARHRQTIIISVLLFIVIAILILIGFIAHDIAENRRLDATSVILKPDDQLVASFGSEVHLSDFIEHLEGSIVDDFIIPTDALGEYEVSFEYINVKNRRRPAHFTIQIIDNTPPSIYGSSAYTIPVNYAEDLTDLMLSGDDLDDHPTRKIIGNYDLSRAGDYNVTYRITDASGNSTDQDFTLHVINPTNSTASPTTTHRDKLPISTIIRDHKTPQTKIGIDVSAWQGEIDWSAVKSAGVEFAFIRLGYQNGYGGEYILDRYFEDNITGATAAGLPVGVYFYSYADSIDEATSQARWIIDQVQNYPIELGIAFDWEDWSNFNQVGMSFHTINQVASTYLDEVSVSGFQPLLYGSKNYLDRIWQPSATKYPVWLAQYYDHPTYTGNFYIWQMSDTGRVPGINGDVDLDIMYLK